MDAGQIIVISLSLVLALWLVGGIWYNRRRRQRIWRWLEAGLDVFGGRVNTVWIGSTGTGLHTTIENPVAPFRRIELIVRLESRENLPLWVFERVQGRRDQLALRAWIRSPGGGELEAVPADSPLDRALQRQVDPPWQRSTVVPGWVIAQRGNVPQEQAEALRALVAAHNRQLQRFSKRRSEPHLFIQMSLSGFNDHASPELLSRVKATMVF